MPGILIMDQPDVDGEGAMKESQGAVGKPVTNGEWVMPQLDGAADLPNGVAVNGDRVAAAGQVDIPDSLLDLPPEIQHITFGYQPLGKLIARVAQECMNDLTETIDAMAEMPVPSNSGMMNGIGGHASPASPDVSAVATQKRLLMMNFAHKHRARFIKLLVLSNWSRQVDQVGRLIDLFAWFRRQDELFDEASHWIGMLRLNMAGAKIPNPDIKTALEVLSTGKVSWVPDLGYVPLEPLSPNRMLKVLRNLNTLLTIRLNLHDELPPHLRSFSVHSGRATFVIPSEFELDISIADEDPTARFYFIDLRFLFRPAPDLPDGYFRNVLEGRCNDILERSGISGCYDFLHNFVLTHKIRTLRRQAVDMTKARWADGLRIEDAHRMLIVQYWVDVPGSKSWLEFGLESGRPKHGRDSWKGPGTPKLGCRWIRNGMHMREAALDLDWTELSMERMLKKVVALHASHNLRAIHDRLLTLAPAEGPTMTLKTSETDAVHCLLSVQLKNSSQATTVRMEPHTGRYYLKPGSPASARIEFELNGLRDAALDGATKVAHQACLHHQLCIERHAERFGWVMLRNLDLKAEHIRSALRHNFTRASFFRVPGWEPGWTITVTVTLSGESWWVVKLANASTGGSIQTASPVHPDTSVSKSPSISQALLRRVERLAVATITFNVTTADLRSKDISHSLRFEAVRSAASPAGDLKFISVPALYIRASDLRDPPNPGGHKSTEPLEGFKWFSDFLRLSHHGFDPNSRKVGLVLKGLMLGKFNVQDLITATRDRSVTFYKNGSFTLRLQISFGKDPTALLVKLLRNVARLRTCVEVLRNFGLALRAVSLTHISFTYAADLTAAVSFLEDGPVGVELERSSPHRRIATLLRAKLSHRVPEIGFHEFARSLVLTLPLLQAFDRIETSQPLQPQIHPRSTDWYRIKYQDPPCNFEVRLRRRRDVFLWYVEDKSARKEDRAEAFAGALRSLFQEQNPAEGRIGMRRGFTVPPAGIGEGLVSLDRVVREYTGRGISTESEKVKTTNPAGTPAGGGPAGGAQAGTGGAQRRGAVTKKPEVITLD